MQHGNKHTTTMRSSLRTFLNAVRQAIVFPLAERIEWYQNMLVITNAGVSKQDALAEIQSANARVGRRAQRVYADLLRGVTAGTNFGVVVAGFVPPSEHAVLAAGDAAGTNDGYRSAAAMAQGLRRMRSTLASRLAYPLGLLFLFVGMVRGYASTILPIYDQRADQVVLSWDLRVYLFMLRAVTEHPMLIGLVVVASLLAIAVSLPLYRGRFRRHLDRWFLPHAIYRHYVSAVVLLALGAMLRARLPLEEALKHVVRHATPYVHSHMSPVLAAVMRGQSAINVWDTGLFPLTYMIRIAALARAGSVGEAIVSLGDTSLDYAVSVLTFFAAVASGVLILGVAVMIGYSMLFLNAVGLAAAHSL